MHLRGISVAKIAPFANLAESRNSNEDEIHSRDLYLPTTLTPECASDRVQRWAWQVFWSTETVVFDLQINDKAVGNSTLRETCRMVTLDTGLVKPDKYGRTGNCY